MTRKAHQLDLLEDPEPGLPEGVTYHPEIVSEGEERQIAEAIGGLDLKPFAFQGFLGNRRTASFGWRYDFNGGGFQQAEPMPAAFRVWRDRAAAFAGVEAESLEQMLAIEYSAGAGIGWHRDRPQFGIVVAISLLSPCRLRFRRKAAEGWERMSANLAPRSGYVLDGPGRSEWEHSIPALDSLRYSLTFRTLNRSAASQSTRTTR